MFIVKNFAMKESSLCRKFLFSNLTLKPQINSVSEFNEFEPLLESAKNWFQFSAGLNLEKFNTILSGTNNI